MTMNSRLRAEILWTQEHKHPHSCGDQEDGPLCAQNLDGTCDRKTCAYFGLKAASDEDK
jgi:hypothetical protein